MTRILAAAALCCLLSACATVDGDGMDGRVGAALIRSIPHH